MTATGTARFVAPALPPPGAQAERPPGGGAGTAPFTRVATAVVRGRGLGLSPWAKLLYVALCSYADPQGGCFPGYATLQADVGCGINQLTKAIRELEAAGLVTRRRRGQGHPTRYTVHAPAPTAPDPVLIHSQSESRLPRRVNLESPPAGAEQDSEELDPAEQHQPAPRTPLAPTACTADEPTSAGDDAALVEVLLSHGMTERIARALARTHGAEAIREQLAWQPHRPKATNPAGALVQAIRERWPAPPAWRAARERAAAGARREEEERRRHEEEAARRRAWEQKPPEERIAGRLEFWVLGRRAKRHEPTAAEIAAKQAELLAALAAGAPAAAGTG
jgi:Helix-turn-helix domain